jgi:hypothetical protein
MRCKQLLDGIKEEGGYWKAKEESVNRILWKILLERSLGPAIRQTTE